MRTNSDTTETPSPRPSMAALVNGLVQDLKILMAQEIRLARHEFQSELTKVRTAAVGAAGGIALAALGGLMLLLMLVHLLHEVAALPLWGSYGIVGGALIASGGAWLWCARAAAADLHVMPPKTAQTVKENLTWLKEQATSPRT